MTSFYAVVFTNVLLFYLFDSPSAYAAWTILVQNQYNGETGTYYKPALELVPAFNRTLVRPNEVITLHNISM